MCRIAVYIFSCVAFLLATVHTSHGASYCVSATGNDSNDGLSEKTSFSSLDKAVLRTSRNQERAFVC